MGDERRRLYAHSNLQRQRAGLGRRHRPAANGRAAYFQRWRRDDRPERKFYGYTDGSISPFEPDVTQANQYSLVDSIGEPIAGDGMSGGGFSFQSGFVPNTPPNISGGIGGEGDVADRPNGDGLIQANDVVQTQRYQIGLDQPQTAVGPVYYGSKYISRRNFVTVYIKS